MAIEQRSIRLRPYTSSVLNRNSYDRNELYLDTTNKTLRIMDGATLGGFKLASEDYVGQAIDSVSELFNNSILLGHPTIEGVTSTGATGTGKIVFDNSPTITGHPTIEGVTSTGATGTGKIVFDNSPTLITPTLGTPVSGNFSTGSFTWPVFPVSSLGTGTPSSNTYLRGDGTWNSIVVDTATNLTGGNNTTLLGSIPYQSNLNTTAQLSPNTTTTKKFLNQTGNGTNGAAPTWSSIATADVPNFYLGTTDITFNRASASQSLTGISIDGSAGSATKSTNLTGGNSTTLLGSIPYQSNTDTTTLLSPNTTTTKKFLRQTGNGTNGAAPSWDTVTATDVGLGNVTNESKSTMFSGPTFTGTTSLQQTVEKFVSSSIVANAVTLDFSLGAIFSLGSNSSNITANFTNVPTTAGQTITVTIVISQGSTAYIPNALTINTVSQTIKWLSVLTPSGYPNNIDMISFTFLCTATNTYTVIGSLSTYG